MLTLIDGNSLLFRAYYGVHSRLTRSDGTPIGAVYGFFNMVLPLFSAANSTDSFVCVFDASRITFRQDIYPAYKMNRAETPADLTAQGIIIRRGLAAMGVPVLCVPNVEADDVIATLARQNCTEPRATRIITSDKDLMQLVSECVFLYDGMKQREVHEPDVLEKFGVLPTQVVDVQSLMGDSSDNVPGVTGIGPKTASELIRTFGSLDNLYTHLDDVSNQRIRNLLRENRDMAYVSRQLVTLRTDVDLSDLTLGPLVFNRRGALDFIRTDIESNALINKVNKLFPETATTTTATSHTTEFSFSGNACDSGLTPDTLSDTPPAPQNIKYTHQIIRTADDLDAFLSGVKGIIALDTETTGLDFMASKLVGISLATSRTSGAYIPLGHCTAAADLFGDAPAAPNQLSIDVVYKKLWPILTNKSILKVGHNLKYDFHILSNMGWDTSKITPFDDTMLLSYILNGTSHNHGLDELALRYLGHETIKFASLFPPKTRDSDMNFAHLPIETAAPYAAEDACVTFALYEHMRPKLDADKRLEELYQTCDLPLMPILLGMERTGVLADRQKLNKLSGIFHAQLQTLQQEIWELAGHEFNIASPKQLGVVLFEELGLPANKKRSTDADRLNELTDSHPIIDKILTWRSVAKLAGTYADSLPRQIGSDGRIHTTYLQTSTNTGRLSSRDPNLQNIPIKTALGEEIRKCFIAPSGYKLISVDYSQIQLRLLADIAHIQTFCDTFNSGSDIHEQTARKIFNIPESTIVPRDLRRAAKTVNFSIIYGISSFGLAAQLGVTRAEAQKIIDSYLSGLPEIQEYIARTKEFATQHACVYTPWGRRIELPDINNPRMRAYALRAAINAPIQGFEADLMRRAMIMIHQDILRDNSDKIRMIMQVHDEMVFECQSEFAKEFAQKIKHAMENVTTLSVPLVAEYVIDTKWGK
ncbi:MAG: DNA polymerase I [Alphaproteobacteria bacterium]|nr:DNA polymerase I [Alphaproteobacteria bacterium]